jgi:hypothetical protein
MPILRNLILKFVSRETAKKMEAESRGWKLKCKCGHETDYWEIGGIRYKAASRGKKMLIRCPTCGLTWHEVYYDKNAAIAEKEPEKDLVKT